MSGRAPATADVLLWLTFRRVECFKAALEARDLEELRRLRARHEMVCELSDEVRVALEGRRKACPN